MAVDIRDSIVMGRRMEMVNLYGQMGLTMKGSGKIIKCMDLEYLSGWTVGSTMDNMRMIRNMDLEYLNGKMEKFVRVYGIKVKL